MHKKLHILLLGLLLSFAVGASEITAGLKGYRLAVAIASMTTDASNVIINNTNQQVLKETIGEDFVKNWQTITAIGDAALLGSMTVTAFRNNSTQSAEALALWNQNKTKLERTLAQNVEKIIENEDMLRGGARAVEGADEYAGALKNWDNLSFDELAILYSKYSKTDIKHANNITKSAKSANLEFELDYLKRITDGKGNLIDPQNFRPPYKKGSFVEEFALTEDALFVRCYNEYQTGSWMISIEDFNAIGKNSDMIKDVLALPTKPTKYALVKIPAGTKIRKGISAKIWDDTFKWANGGATQYQIINFDYNTMGAWFKKLGDL